MKIYKDGVYEYLHGTEEQQVIIIFNDIGYLPGWECPLTVNEDRDSECWVRKASIGQLLLEFPIPATRTGPGRLSGTQVPGNPGLYYL